MKPGPVDRVQRGRPFGRLRPRRRLTLRVEQVQPVIRIAHRLTGGMNISERIIFDHELVLILAGRGEWAADGRWQAFAAHDLLFIPPFTPHAFRGDAGAPPEHIAVHFDFAPDCPPAGRGLDRRAPYEVRLTHGLRLPRQRTLCAGHRIERALLELLRERAKGGPLDQLAAAAQLTAVLIALLRESAAPGGARPSAPGSWRNQARVAQVIARLKAGLTARFDAAALAALGGVSVSRLNALFREVTGHAPLDYLRRLRVEEARRLLADVRLSIKEVAARTGFDDAYHFSKVFRRLDGLSPAHYREALLAGRQAK